MKQSEQQIIYQVVRQFIYFAVIFGFIFLVHLIARDYEAVTFSENGIVENIQLFFLVASTGMFSLLAWRFKQYRALLLLLASFCLFACCRELDEVLDEIVPYVHWKFAFLFPLMAVCYAIENLSMTNKSVLAFFSMPAFFMMYLAIIIILPLGQCIGHGPFVRSVFGDVDYVAAIKEFYEESAEIIGYLLVLLSSVELYFDLRRLR